MVATGARGVNVSQTGLGAKLPSDSSGSTARIVGGPVRGSRARKRTGTTMPRMKLSPTLLVTVASLIALGGPILAAPETTQSKKPVAAAAKKDAAKRHAAGKPAPARAAAHK